MKHSYPLLALATIICLSPEMHASKAGASPQLQRFLESIKDASTPRSRALETFKQMGLEEQERLCEEMLEPGFPTVASSFNLGVFKRNDLTNYCQTLEKPKEQKQVGVLTEDHKPKASTYESHQRDVGRLSLPSAPESSSHQGVVERKIGRIKIPEHLLVVDKGSQEKSIQSIQEALRVAESQVGEDRELQSRIKEVQKNLQKAEEDYNTMGLVVETLRESVAEMNRQHGLFSTFNPASRAQDTHEVYLENILQHQADLRAAAPYNRNGELDQLPAAQRLLEESKQALELAREELRKLT